MYNYYEKLEAQLDGEQYAAQERILYNVDYLLRKTEEFGVKAFEPSPVPFGLTKQQMAWYSWWDEAFTTKLKEEPWTLQEWKKFPRGFDPKFKPKGSYKDRLRESEKEEKE